MPRPRTRFAHSRASGETAGIVVELQAEFDAHLAGDQFPAAIDTGRRLLAVLDGLGDPIGQAEGEVALGTALMACGQAREAKPWFRRAQALLRAHGLPEDFALAYFNLGLDFGWMKKLALGKAAFRRSTALYRQLGRKEELRQGQVLLGYTMVLLGELDAALPILMEAGRDLELLAPFDRVLLHLAEAELHLGQGRFAMAEEALARRFRVGSELEDPKVMADSLYRMAYLKNRLRDDWAVRTFLTEAQACIAGLGYPEAEARIMTFMQASRRKRRPAHLQPIVGTPPLHRCS